MENWTIKNASGTVLYRSGNEANLLKCKTATTEAKEYYSRDWIEKNGADVYLPPARAIKAKDVTFDFFVFLPEANANAFVHNMWNILFSAGKLLFEDLAGNRTIRLFLTKFEEIDSKISGGKKYIQFKLTGTVYDE